MRRPNTPGIFGYVLGSLVSASVCAALLLLPSPMEATGPFDVLAGLGYVAFAAMALAMWGVPAAVAVALVTEVLCRRVSSQAVHIAVVALSGVLVMTWYGPVIGLDDLGSGPVLVDFSVGCAAAVGRAAVIPLVRSRRRLAAVGRLTGTARW